MIDKVISGRQTTPPLETCDNVAEERSPVKKPVNTAAATNSSGGPLLIHYGDMELFLISIQLGNLMSLFQVCGFIPGVCLILRCMHVFIQVLKLLYSI